MPLQPVTQGGHCSAHTVHQPADKPLLLRWRAQFENGVCNINGQQNTTNRCADSGSGRKLLGGVRRPVMRALQTCPHLVSS